MKSCLQCGEEFESKGRFNRVCKTCKKTAKSDPGFFKTCFSNFEIEGFLTKEENLCFKESFKESFIN